MSIQFDLIASYYDLFYVQQEEYRAEADQVCRLIRKYQTCQSHALLDLACGTGEQSRFLIPSFDVTGLDLSEGMLTLARQKVPDAVFIQGDIFDFHLERKFGAVINLYGSVGFARGMEELQKGLDCAYRCLQAGGVLILTPWHTRETFREEMIAHSGTEGEICYCRLEAVKRAGVDKASVEMIHLLGKKGEIQEYHHRQEISLFSEEEYRSALQQAGFCLRERLSEEEFRMGAFVCTKEAE